MDLRRKRDRRELERKLDLRRPHDLKDFWKDVDRLGLVEAVAARGFSLQELEKEIG